MGWIVKRSKAKSKLTVVSARSIFFFGQFTPEKRGKSLTNIN